VKDWISETSSRDVINALCDGIYIGVRQAKAGDKLPMKETVKETDAGWHSHLRPLARTYLCMCRIQAIVEREDSEGVALGPCVLARDDAIEPIAEERASEREGKEGRMKKVGRLRRE
jgi:hypothetical protein